MPSFVPELSTLLPFLVAALTLNLTPGADMTYVIARSAGQGRLTGISSAFGVSAGALVHTLLAAVGLSALVMQSETAFQIIKFAGAALRYVQDSRPLRNQSFASSLTTGRAATARPWLLTERRTGLCRAIRIRFVLAGHNNVAFLEVSCHDLGYTAVCETGSNKTRLERLCSGEHPDHLPLPPTAAAGFAAGEPLKTLAASALRGLSLSTGCLCWRALTLTPVASRTATLSGWGVAVIWFLSACGLCGFAPGTPRLSIEVAAGFHARAPGFAVEVAAALTAPAFAVGIAAAFATMHALSITLAACAALPGLALLRLSGRRRRCCLRGGTRLLTFGGALRLSLSLVFLSSFVHLLTQRLLLFVGEIRPESKSGVRNSQNVIAPRNRDCYVGGHSRPQLQRRV